MQNHQITGTILINKPAGITSYDCIRKIKKILWPDKPKIGHAGTLDPFASGLLIICIGRQATKNIDNLVDKDKEYWVKAKLGELTDTLDLTGNVIEEKNISKALSRQQIQSVFDNFEKNYIQTPPAYSALKFNGTPLYQLARENQMNMEELNKILCAKKREVTIHRLELIDFDLPFFTFKAHVSKGTYIRSLANDIAQKLGIKATTYELCRTKIGNFKIEQAKNLEDIKSIENIQEALLPE